MSGAYRSGTSWIGDLLAGEGTWHIHEPFSPRAGFLSRNFVYCRAGEQDPKLDKYVKRLLSGRKVWSDGVGMVQGIAVTRALMPARLGLFSGVPRRVLIKDPLACLMTEYLVRNHQFRAVLIMRHPAGFASSLEQLGWDTSGELQRLLEDEKLVEDWLEPYCKELKQAASKPGIAAHVGLYAAIWMVLSGFAQQNSSIVTIKYEDLCGDVCGVIRGLYEHFGLGTFDELRLERYRIRTSRADANGTDSPFSLRRNIDAMGEIWRKRLDADVLREIQALWVRFPIPHYQGKTEW